MSKKKTEWFDGSIKPRRSGVYQTIAAPGLPVAFQRWNGDKWFYRSGDAELAQSVKIVSFFQEPQWRGLANKPEDA